MSGAQQPARGLQSAATHKFRHCCGLKSCLEFVRAVLGEQLSPVRRDRVLPTSCRTEGRKPRVNTAGHGCGRRSRRICLCAGWWDEHRCRVGRPRRKPQSNVPLKEPAGRLEMIRDTFKGRIERGYAVRRGPSCAAPGCRPGAEHVQEAEHKNNQCVPRTPNGFCVFRLGLLGALCWSNSHEARLHRRLLRAIDFEGTWLGLYEARPDCEGWARGPSSVSAPLSAEDA